MLTINFDVTTLFAAIGVICAFALIEGYQVINRPRRRK